MVSFKWERMLKLTPLRQRLSLVTHVTRVTKRPIPSSHIIHDQTRWTGSESVSKRSREVPSTEVKDFRDIPGPRSFPVIGTLYKYFPFVGEYSFNRFHETNMKRFSRYGHIVREEMAPGFNMVYLFDPDDISTLFRNDGPYPLRPTLYGSTKHRETRGIPFGMANLNGKEWHTYRNNIQKTMLQRTSAVPYITAHAQVSQDFVESMRSKRDGKGEIPDFFGELLKWATESIGVLCFDSRLGLLDQMVGNDSENVRLIQAVKGAFRGHHRALMLEKVYERVPNAPTMRRLFDDLDTIQRLGSKNVENILLRMKNNEEMLIPPDRSFLLNLLAKPGLSREEAVVQVLDLFSGGIDTTSSSIAFNFYMLATNQECQKKLQEEVDRLAPKGTTLTNAILDQMKYLRAFTKETFRFMPTAPVNMRITSKDMVLSGYQIPAGTQVFCAHSVICRISKYYDDPDSFKPERWLRESNRQSEATSTQTEKGTTHPFSMLPFGHGPRMCVGRRFAEQELWIFLIKTMQEFNVEYHYEPIGQITSLINSPDRPLRFTFTDRKG